jgi:hypothetical protein
MTYLGKSNNRAILQELDALRKEGKHIEGALVDGLRVVVGSTGTLKLTEPTHKSHSH